VTAFNTEIVGSALVVAPEGRLDLVAARDFREVVNRAVAAGNVHVVIDMTKVEFLDSSGLGALITGLKSTRQAGGSLRIAGLNEQALMVLDLTMLQRVLFPYKTLAEALTKQ
jgi:anti-sigma B factor antagonist